VAPTPKRGARIGLGIAFALGVAFVGLLGVRVKQAIDKREALAGERPDALARAQKRLPAQTVRPTAVRWTPRVEVTGTLKPWAEADLGFETSGRLVRVAVAVGDEVKPGQMLAVLDASRAVAQVGQAESQVRAAEASLALAEDTRSRTEALALTKAVPEAQVEQARQHVALARAQLEGAQASARLAKSGAGLNSIAAPFAGVVTKAPTGIGSVVNPGVPLVHIEDTSRFRLSATLGEEDVPLVTTGSTVKVSYRDRVVEGKVIAVVPSLDQATRRAPVEIEVPNEDRSLLAWGFVRARIEGAAEVNAVRLPALARRPGSQDEVVALVDGRARIRKVSFAVDEDGSLVVQRGLAASDTVLLSPSVELREGDLVVAEPGVTEPGQ
jgi:RND family efflux transporter MFP subunit